MAGRLVEAEPARDDPADALTLRGTRVPSLALLAIVVVATIAAQAPVLSHYFFGDDFVPLADVGSRGTGEYLKDLFLLDDITPNWRFLTGVFYLVWFEAFGTNALPYLATAVAFHAGAAALVFHFVRRGSGSVAAALVAGLVFGLTPASVPTVGQVTAINNVFGGFFVMLSIVLVYESFERSPRVVWAVGSVLAFATAIAANESVAVLAIVPALVAFWRAYQRDGADWLRAGALYAAPFAILGLAALIGFGAACECTEAADDRLYGTGDHVVDNVFIFTGRLLYPVGLEPLGDVGTTHLLAGIALIGVAAYAFIAGPTFTRIAVVFLVLALVPYIPLKLWSAPRYVYVASIPFAMLAGILLVDIAGRVRSLSPVLPAVVSTLAIGALGLFVWQTWSQNEEFDDKTRPWQALVEGVEEALPNVPAQSTVYVVGSSLDDPLLQCVVMPSLGEVVWGETKLFTFPRGDETYRLRPAYSVFLLEETERGFNLEDVPVAGLGDEGATLLPHVPPEAEGNLCVEEIPAFEP